MDDPDSEIEEYETEDSKSSILGDELASKLSEPKTQLMIGVVELFGQEVSIELFEKTKGIESNGGMMIKNGERRRTPGGVFLQLLRDYGSDESEKRVDNAEVRRFFANSNQTGSFKRKRKHKFKGDFKSELDAFKNLSTKMLKKKSSKESGSNEVAMENDETEELKPLPDLLTCINQRKQRLGKTKSSGESSQKSGENAENDDNSVEIFAEPDAPPNSVERTVNSYDDDFLNADCDTEDIELF